MKLLSIITVFVLTIFLFGSKTCAANKDSQRGFLLTAPSIFTSNSTSTLCITFHDIDSQGHFKVTLKTNTTVDENKQYVFSGKGKCFQLKVSPTNATSGILSVEGAFNSINFEFSNSTNVNIQPSSIITYIQTDKPIYKPSQLVLFRILSLTSTTLKPINNVIKTIWVENPKGIKISKWSAVPSNTGLTDLKFELSDEPQLGTWKIFTEEYSGKITNKTFIVEKYVLPTFSVNIRPPKVILTNFKEFKWAVCANYTYGEPVIGKISVNISYISVVNETEQKPVQVYKEENKFEKCHVMTFKREQLGKHKDSVNDTDILSFYAEVTEHGTEVTEESSQRFEIRESPFRLSIVSKPYFKPGIPYNGKVLLESMDPSQYNNKRVDVNIETFQDDHLQVALRAKTGDDGIAHFTLPLKSTQDNKIVMRLGASYAGGPIDKPNRILKYIRGWVSLTRSYLQIDPIPRALKCDETFDLNVKFTKVEQPGPPFFSVDIHYQLVSRNAILVQQVHPLKLFRGVMRGSQATNFTLPVKIQPIMSPKVQILVYYIKKDGEIVSDSESFDVEECFPNKVSLKLNQTRVSPGSLTPINISAEVNSLCSTGIVDKSVHLLAKETEGDDYKIFFPTYGKPVPNKLEYVQCSKNEVSLFMDPSVTFETIGMVFVTNLELPSPCKDNRKMSNDDANELVEVNERLIGGNLEKRDYFPETWLWELSVVGNDGLLTLNRTIPHTITDWVGKTVCISNNSGFGISPVTSITTFQPFFLTYTLPYSAKYNETIPLVVTVFNYMGGCLPIYLTLELPQGKPFTLEGKSNEAKLCVCGDKSLTYKFYITPLEIGLVNITVRAQSIPLVETQICKNEKNKLNAPAYDAMTKPLLVIADSFPKENVKNYWLCADDFKSDVKTFTHKIDVPKDAIKGSVKLYIKATGDIMAPTILNMNHLIREPTGCGEQNMISFAPLLFVYRYLDANKKFDAALKATALRHMNTGYQRQLNYRQSTKGFAVWHTFPTSMWLTAFVVKCFAQALPIIYIDTMVIEGAKQYILSNQMANGCFQYTGNVIHKEMIGAVGSDQTSISIYATISLLEAFASPNSVEINRAITCITNDKTALSVYLLSMKAYALALANRTDAAADVIKSLEKRSSKQGENIYWNAGNRALNIETTAYVLLTLMTLNNPQSFTLAKNIANWIAEQRNTQGGFISTQDTVIALQAMEKFSNKLKKDATDMYIEILGGKFPSMIQITEANKLSVQSEPISVGTDSVEITVEGQGCSMIQIVERYNSKLTPVVQSIYLDVNILAYDLPTQLVKHVLEVCTNYRGKDGKTNMVVVAVQMVTGFAVEGSSLDKLKSSDVQLRRWEIEHDGTAELYFDQLTSAIMCFQMVVKETDKIKNAKPAIVKAYDYYNPDHSLSRLYALRESSDDENEIAPADAPPPPPPQCPICRNQLDEALKIKQCSSKSIIGVDIMNVDTRELMFTMDHRKRVKIYLETNYALPPNCQCANLRSGQKFLFSCMEVVDTKAKLFQINSNCIVSTMQTYPSKYMREMDEFCKSKKIPKPI